MVLICAIKHVPTLMAPTCVSVKRALHSTAMEQVAMVRLQSSMMQVLDDTQIPFATDVNECTEGTHQCQQACLNTIGSYTCGCNDGFMLGTDGRSCNGKNPFFSTLSLL